MNVNRCFLGGNLCADPEMRFAQNGTGVCKARMAVNRNWTSNGEKKEEVSFFSVTIFGKRGEAFAKYLKKGDPVFIEGRLKQDSWEDKETKAKRSKIEVICEDWQFVSPRGEAPAETATATEEIPF